MSRPLARAHELPLRYASLRWAVLGLGIAVSLGSAYYLDSELANEAHANFQASAVAKANDVELRVKAYSDVLYALRGLFDASKNVTRDDFHEFAAALQLAERYPGLTNISFAPLVPRAGRAAFERAVRAETSPLLKGLPPFSIKSAGERPEYVVLHYVEPMGKNVAAWGLDLTADPLRRSVVERARDSGALSASSGITLVRDSATGMASALLRLAVYRGGGVPRSPEERHRLYTGVVGSTVRVGELAEAALSGETLARMRLRVFTAPEALGGGAAAPDLLLYDSLGGAGVPAEYLSYAFNYRLVIADREWRLELTPRTIPVDALDRVIPAVVLTAMLALSALVFWLISSLATILRLRDELLEQATHDSLTGLHNRRYMEEWLRQELHRARRHERRIGVIMLDIDHFKRINDRLGHEAGDIVLRELAGVVRRASRGSDVVCRYGGEELVVLMPEASFADAARKADELRAAVAAMRLECQGRPVGPLAISLGVSGFPEHAQDADTLLRRADEALYAAKQAGRDRAAVAALPAKVPQRAREPVADTA
jgi:diguanylate cyclase (GGDEF)-like protein